MKWQIDFLNDPHPIKVLIAGRQSGKSHALQAGIAKVCGTTPGRSAVVMPVQSQATDFFKLTMTGAGFENLLAQGKDGSEVKLWPYPQMNFKSGHYLEWRSFENSNRLRGGKWDGLVLIDEANDLDGDEVSRVILPKVSTTKAQVLITSTVTHFNWLWEYYLRGQGNDPMVKSWLYTSESGFKFQTDEGKKRLQDLKSVTPQWIWDSEYLCIPSSDNSACFVYWDRCLVDSLPPDSPQPHRRYLIGLDLGRVRDQEIAIVGDDQGQIVDIVEFPTGSASQEHAQMAQRINSLSHFWNNARVIVDATGKGGKFEEGDSHAKVYQEILDDRFEPFFWSANRDNQTKYDVISHLSLLTEQRKLKCPKKFQTLSTQMKAYRILKAKGNNSTFGPSATSKVNDDAVAALAQYAWGLKENWFGDDEDEKGGPSLGSVFG